MKTIKKKKTNQGIGKVVLALNIFVLLFVGLSRLLNVYQVAYVGAMFEILWLPVILLLFILPTLSIINWIQDKFNPKSIYLYSMILGIAAVILMVYGK
jgi:amino acid permease